MINLTSNLFITVDIIIGLIYLINIITSFKNGFIYGFVSLICLVLSIWLAWFVSPILAKEISFIALAGEKTAILKLLGVDIFVDTVIWFFIIFIVVNIIVLILKPLFKSLTKVPIIGPLNKMLGIVIGIINATIITLILSLVITSPLFENGKEIKENTCLAYISSITDKISHIVYERAIDEFAGKIEFNADEQRDKLTNWFKEQGIFND